jgi:prolyl 4-hydroxylase
MRLPRLIVFGNLLSDAECDALIELARPKLERSFTVDSWSGGDELSAVRTSEGTYFERAETEVIARVERRIAELVDWPAERGEGLQILRYGRGAEYLPHHDYFDPTVPGGPVLLKNGGPRVATLIMYLNTPTKGGSTIFPDVAFEVAPLRGNAVFFSYNCPHPATCTLHGGAPVIEGEKWIATKWLRAEVFK